MNDASAQDAGVVTGTPRAILRVEGLALFLGALASCWAISANWWLVAALFLVPDLSFAAYVFGRKAGSIAYNAMHTLTAPLVLLVLNGVWFSQLAIATAALVWIAHIGFDRMLGFGLKYQAGFGFTHLGKVGRAA